MTEITNPIAALPSDCFNTPTVRYMHIEFADPKAYARMFIGPIPKPGDVVEIVCVEADDRSSEYLLRVREQP